MRMWNFQLGLNPLWDKDRCTTNRNPNLAEIYIVRPKIVRIFKLFVGITDLHKMSINMSLKIIKASSTFLS